MKKYEPRTTRRKFVKRVSLGGLGSFLLSKLPMGIREAFATTEKSKIVRVHHPGATDGSGGKDNEHLIESAVREMVREGVKAFTGAASVTEAWTTIIPDPAKKVAIKVNCQITGIYTKSTVVNCIIEGLVDRGVSTDNIVIYDRTDNAFCLAGFTKNTGSGVKVGKVSELGGWSSTSGFYGMAKLLCGESGEFDCDYLINVPCHKALDGFSGVTLSMKNHYGTCSPNHDDIMNRIPLYNALPQIRDKTRLIVLDAIFCEYKWFNGRGQSTIEIINKLLFATDPVALDYVGWQMIESLRTHHELPSVAPHPDFIRIAAVDYELGTNDSSQIEIVDLNLVEDSKPIAPKGLRILN